MKDKNLLALCEGAAVIAIAMLLGYVKLFELPQGGSITIGMLPIFIYCYKWGLKKGYILSFAYGVFQLLLDGAYAWSPWSMLLDYVLAYGALGICGLYNKNIQSLVIGSVVAAFCRFIVHFISGVTIYKIYAPTELFNHTFTSPILYSALYNGSFIFISIVLCIILILILQKFINNYKNWNKK